MSGTTLIIGHVSWAGQYGVFNRLDDLKVGDPVQVEVGSIWLHYRVVVLGEYTKGALPSSVFAISGSPALALVTCAGSFNYATGHYTDNVVVMAVPTSGTSNPDAPRGFPNRSLHILERESGIPTATPPVPRGGRH